MSYVILTKSHKVSAALANYSRSSRQKTGGGGGGGKNQRTKENQGIILRVQRESFPDIKLIRTILTDTLRSIIGVINH